VYYCICNNTVPERRDLLPTNNSIGRILKCLDEISSKIDSLIEISKDILSILNSKGSVNIIRDLPPDALSLLSLPSSLRKTILAVYKLGEATAEELAMETGRMRAIESSHANQLVRMGYLKKRRRGRKVIFYIDNNLSEEL